MRSPRIARIFIAASSLVITLVGLEWYLRHRINSYWSLVMPPSESTRRYDLRPHTYARYKGITMTIDGDGMRTTLNPYVTAPHDTHVRRVLFLGDSFMFGLGCRDQHTIPTVFAHLSARDGAPVAAYNAGVFGYDLRDEFSALERWKHIRPDAVIWSLFENDLTPKATFIRLSPREESHWDKWKGHSILLRVLDEKLSIIRDRFDSAGDAHQDAAVRKGVSPIEDTISQDEARALFARVSQWACSESVPVYVVPIPAPFRLQDSAPPDFDRQVSQWTTHRNILLLDIWPMIRGDHGFEWHAADMIHYNDTGCQNVAAAIYTLYRDGMREKGGGP